MPRNHESSSRVKRWAERINKIILLAIIFAFNALGYAATVNAVPTKKRIDFCNAKISKASNYDIKKIITKGKNPTKKETKSNDKNMMNFQKEMEKCLGNKG